MQDRSVNDTQGIDVSQFNGTIDWSTVPTDENSDFTFIRAVRRLTITGEILDASSDGSQQQYFTVNNPVLRYTETVYYDGVEQTRGTDYFMDYDNGGIFLDPAPASSTEITIDYYSLEPDHSLTDNINGATNNNIPFGFYFFARPKDTNNSAEAQADFLIETLENELGAGNYGELFPVLDLEILNGYTIEEVLNWAEHFVTYFKEQTNRTVMIYAAHFFIEDNDNFLEGTTGNPLKSNPLWVALWDRFNTNNETVSDVGGWTEWQVWQYTDSGLVNGIGEQFTDEPLDPATGDGTNTTFNMEGGPVARAYGNEVVVYIDGVEQTEGEAEDYTVNYDVGVVEFNTAPANGTSITADYVYPSTDLNRARSNLDYLRVPSQVTNVNVNNTDSTEVELEWDTNPEVDIVDYNIYIDGVLEEEGIPDTNNSTITYTITGLSTDTSYDFNVSANDEWDEGELSTTVSATTVEYKKASFYKKVNIIINGDPVCIEGLNDATLNRGGDVLDDTEFCNNQNYRKRIYGLRDVNLNLSGTSEISTTVQQELLNSWINMEPVTIQYLPDGSNGLQCDFVIESIDESGAVGDIENIDYVLQSVSALQSVGGL